MFQHPLLKLVETEASLE